MENGADKIRINPGNIGSTERIKAVVDVAKERNIPIRVGVNSGSLEKELVEKYHGVTAEGLVESALDKVHIIEKLGYDNLVISIKSSDVMMCASSRADRGTDQLSFMWESQRREPFTPETSNLPSDLESFYTRELETRSASPDRRPS